MRKREHPQVLRLDRVLLLRHNYQVLSFEVSPEQHALLQILNGCHTIAEVAKIHTHLYSEERFPLTKLRDWFCAWIVKDFFHV